MSLDFKRQLSRFLAEDVGRGDVTGALLPGGRTTARIVTREACMVAGAAHARYIFGLRGCSARISKRDGSRARPGQAVMTVTGGARDVLACERTALNILSRMSGIATQTSELVERVPRGVGVYATRKTAPGLRYFDKEAVEIGGGKRHRMGLDGMVMIKDNHIAVAGLEEMIKRARKKRKRFEVEVEDAAGAILAAEGGAAIIMLDNFTPARIRRTVAALKKKGLRGGVTLEASGGITARNISGFARAGVDAVSVGSITNSVRGIDFSLEI